MRSANLAQAFEPASKQAGEEAAPPARLTVSELARDWLKSRHAREAAWRRKDQAEVAAIALSQPYPEDCRAFDERNVAEFSRVKAEGEAAARRVAIRQRPPSFYEWEAQREAAEAGTGLPQAEGAAWAATSQTHAARDQVIRGEATGLRDVAAKLAVLMAHMKEDDFEEGEALAAMTAIHSDLEAMTAEAAVPFETLEEL